MAKRVNTSGNAEIDALLWGWKWSSLTLTYSFPDSADEYTDGGYEEVNGFQAFDDDQSDATVEILHQIENFTNLTFVPTTADSADLRFAEADSVIYTNDNKVASKTGLVTIDSATSNPLENPYNGNAPLSPSYAEGDAWFNRANYNDVTRGGFAYASGLMHELGHNLGLKHGHVTQTKHGYTFPKLPDDHNSSEYSIMAYPTYVGDPNPKYDNARDHATTYMQDDIATLQYLYGADFGFRGTNTVYSWSPTTGTMFVNGAGEGGLPSNLIFMTLWDGGGTDTYDLSNYSTNVTINLAPGSWTKTGVQAQLADLVDADRPSSEHQYARGNIANALLYKGDTRSLIENAIGGSGHDSLYGNQADNTLTGNGGSDTLWSYDGKDTLYGGAGDDNMKGGGGNDSLFGGADKDTMFGEDGADTLWGDVGDDTIDGGDGNDELKGGGGADTLNGGQGSDTAVYFGSTAGVSVTLGNGQGAVGKGTYGTAQGDTLVGIENLSGTAYGDSLFGNQADNTLTGNDGNDTLWSYEGKDTLYGGYGDDNIKGGGGDDALLGGSGKDTMFGEDGADTLSGDDGEDVLNGDDGDDELKGGGGADTLNGGQGRDTARYFDSTVGVTVTLQSGGNVGKGSYGTAQGDTLVGIENLLGSNSGDSLFGNEADNILTGNAGGDTLWSYAGKDTIYGGTGADNMKGGGGGDSLYGGTGKDTIYGEAGKDLLAGDADDDTLYGGSEDDVLIGGGGADVLIGDDGTDRADYLKSATAVSINLQTGKGSGGDAQGDTLFGIESVAGSAFGDAFLGRGGSVETFAGGRGSDIYTVNDAADVVLETIGRGTDTVLTSVDYALRAGQAIEFLATTTTRGTAAIDLTGNDLRQTLTGNTGANDLNGLGGTDRLIGNGGADSFIFSTTPYSRNADRIADFSTTQNDMVDLAKSVFTTLAVGALGAKLFKDLGVAGAAQDRDDQILYNRKTGVLSYDADGLGRTGPVTFATLENKALIDHTDFFIV